MLWHRQWTSEATTTVTPCRFFPICYPNPSVSATNENRDQQFDTPVLQSCYTVAVLGYALKCSVAFTSNTFLQTNSFSSAPATFFTPFVRGIYVARWNTTYSVYTGCPRRKGQNFGTVFLMLKYTDMTQNTYIQSWTFTEIMAREKCGLLAGLRTVPCQLTAYRMSVPDCRVRLQKCRGRSYVSTPLWLTACHV